MKTEKKKVDFTGIDIYVGLDVHYKSWSVSIMTSVITHKTFSQNPDPYILHNYLVKNFPGGNYHAAYEAGFSGYSTYNILNSLGVKTIVINPADVPTTHKEYDRKDDKKDSRKIAKSLMSGHLTAIFVPDAKTLEDRSLVRCRATHVKDITRCKNRIKSLLKFYGIEMPEKFADRNSHWSKRFMEWLGSIEMTEPTGKATLNMILETVKNLRASLLKINKLIRELALTEAYKESYELLKSVPGIGTITAMKILTELEDISRFNSIDTLCGYIGLVPSKHASGEKDIDGNITKRGHSILRSAIIESAWVAARIDPALMKSYHSYCQRMEPNKAIIRIAKKLLSRIKYVLINKKPYECGIVN